jgi:hypothetical protein
MVFCFEERSREPTGETPVPRGMGVPPMSEETRSKTKDRGELSTTPHFGIAPGQPDPLL